MASCKLIERRAIRDYTNAMRAADRSLLAKGRHKRVRSAGRRAGAQAGSKALVARFQAHDDMQAAWTRAEHSFQALRKCMVREGVPDVTLGGRKRKRRSR